MRHLAFSAALAVALSAGAALGFDLSTLPGKPAPVFGDFSAETIKTSGNTDKTAFAIVDVAGQPFTRAVQVTTERTEPSWAAQLVSVNSTVPVLKGDTLFVAFMVRCTAAETESGCGDIQTFLQDSRTYESFTSANAAPGREWKPVYLRFRVPWDTQPGRFQFVIHCGRAKQAVEVADLVAVNLGPGIDAAALPYNRITYEGREPDAAWRKRALTRIESIRKGEVSLRLETPDGKPIPGAKVRARMTRHLYQFGTFLDDGDTLLRESADGLKYRQTVTELFNRATCPLYWADWGWENPERRMVFIAIAQWAKSNGLHTRGHCLVWPSWRWLPKAVEPLKGTPAALKATIDNHLAEVATLMRPIRFDTYDVVNEPRVNHDVQDLLGQQEMANWFKIVRKIDPHPKLCLNEYSIIAGGGNTDAEIETYMKQVRTLIDLGAPVEVLGVQCHIGENLTPPEKIVAILDRLADLRLPIHATEFDIATDDWDAQGDYLRDFLIAFFSHPSTESITQWGFWEKAHWIPRAALFTKDWTPKPAAKAYTGLVNGEWKTDATGETNAQGSFRTRGFYGDYEVTVTLPGGRTVTRMIAHKQNGTTATWQFEP
ncbi:MAG: endo-1,4-beta-xylanase [Kiritimatiellaeota bacterium]|nr:endo-1,4-beta-xylanase [Kiritimatiellota bacterium]